MFVSFWAHVNIVSRIVSYRIGCVTSRYKLSEGSKIASGDLQYIIIAVQYNCVR